MGRNRLIPFGSSWPVLRCEPLPWRATAVLPHAPVLLVYRPTNGVSVNARFGVKQKWALGVTALVSIALLAVTESASALANRDHGDREVRTTGV